MMKVIKPKYIVDITKLFSSIRLNHTGIFQEFSNKIIAEINLYNKEMEHILYNYGNLFFFLYSAILI